MMDKWRNAIFKRIHEWEEKAAKMQDRQRACECLQCAQELRDTMRDLMIAVVDDRVVLPEGG